MEDSEVSDRLVTQTHSPDGVHSREFAVGSGSQGTCGESNAFGSMPLCHDIRPAPGAQHHIQIRVGSETA